MTYWQMDDKFLGHHKTVRALRAGAEALQMWVALRSYVANNESDGVIPDGDIDDLPGAPKNPRKWLKVLVECGKPAIGDEPQGAGLVDALRGAWKLHNYEKRGLSRAQIEAKRDADRTRKERWKERRDGTHPEHRSERVPNASRTPSGTGPRVRAPAGALPSHPIPSHPTEGTESAPAAEADTPSQVQLTAAQRQQLAFQQATPDDVAVIEAWRDRFQKADVNFTADRALPIAERRALGMTQQDALDAVAGAAGDPWFLSQGAKLSLIFNKQERFETYRDAGRDIRAGKPPRPLASTGRVPAPRQPSRGYNPAALAEKL